jgi:hypothetical protein
MRGSLGRAALLTAATLAAAAGATVPTVASAQPYYGRYDDDCRHGRQGNTVAGAIIGGIAGAVIGRSVAGHVDRGPGTVAGAALGGTIGAGIGNSASHCDRYDRHDHRDYYYNRREPYSYYRRDYYDREYDYPGYYARPYREYYDYDRSGDYYDYDGY